MKLDTKDRDFILHSDSCYAEKCFVKYKLVRPSILKFFEFSVPAPYSVLDWQVRSFWTFFLFNEFGAPDRTKNIWKSSTPVNFGATTRWLVKHFQIFSLFDLVHRWLENSLKTTKMQNDCHSGSQEQVPKISEYLTAQAFHEKSGMSFCIRFQQRLPETFKISNPNP